MSINHNWIRATAQRILLDGCIVDLRRMQDTPTEDQIAEIIEIECPFKPGTAYMPVPRCETCKHFLPWDRLDAKIQTHSGRGDCQVFQGDMNGIRQDFGCVQWQEKAVPPKG